MAAMHNCLIIHGHFYQPPREDPWVGRIPHQASAAPYHDWNKRITRECYAANAASRILDPYGRIQSIVNNYRYLSFNVGPTLLGWIEDKAPNVYARIVEADRESRGRNNGHGNAIAQAYNHTILPLAKRDHMVTQVVWGMEDFRHHFGRDPQGMWLPETAINTTVVDVLIASGVRFVVLSPWQAEATCPVGGRAWNPLGERPVPADRAYRIDRPRGSLAVFFYNPRMAHGISFEHFLRNADTLFARVLEYYDGRRPGNLLSVATDGEVYGHHEAFGDMCLAALVRKVEDDGRFVITNYGNYLEQHPPAELVRLRLGEEERGTSWSCAHGVSRWYRDCGCTTGGDQGWNQTWRKPVRDVLDKLEGALSRIFRTQLAAVSSADPLSVRDRYVRVLTGDTEPEAFAREVVDGGSAGPEDIRRVLALLEGQKYGMFMFTSCGWFFADLTGIETVQNLRYALRAAALYQPFATTDLLAPLRDGLAAAKSNLPEDGTGRDLFQRRVEPDAKGPAFAASYFVLRHALSRSGRGDTALGFYRCLALDVSEATDAFFAGTVEVEERPLARRSGFAFRVDRDTEKGVTLWMGPADGGASLRKVDVEHVAYDIRADIAGYLFSTLQNASAPCSEGQLSRLRNTLIQARKLGVRPPKVVLTTAAARIDHELDGILRRMAEGVTEPQLEALAEVLQLAATHELDVDREMVGTRLSAMLAQEVATLVEQLDAAVVAMARRLLEVARTGGVVLDLRDVQDQVFALIQDTGKPLLSRLRSGDRHAEEALRCLIALGEATGFRVDELRQEMLAL
jgi:hypothetical protein